MVDLRVHKKSALLLTALGLISIYLTLYTVTAYTVANHVYDTDGTAVWRSAPSGSFFPWPRKPGILQIFSGMSELDLFIYTCLIRSWVLVLVTTLLWVNTFLYIVNLVRYVDLRGISVIASLSGGLFFTLLSGLYMLKPLIVGAEIVYFGFPSAWVEKSRRVLVFATTWRYYFLWRGFVIDFIVYGLLTATAIHLYFMKIRARLH